MVKIFKIAKQNKSIVRHLSEKLRISSGQERLIVFGVYFILFTHVSTCFFIFVARLEEDSGLVSWIQAKNIESEGFELYVIACYFTITTVATVGYGDFAPETSIERIYCILLMVIGVTSFTFVSGALSSIISNYDQRQSELQEKLLFLNEIKNSYNISEGLYAELRSALRFEADKNFD